MSQRPPTDGLQAEADRVSPVDRRLFGVTEGVRRYMGVTIALGFASALAVIAGAVILAGIVNRVFREGAAPGDLSATLIILALIYAARGLFEWARSVAAYRSAADVKRTLPRAGHEGRAGADQREVGRREAGTSPSSHRVESTRWTPTSRGTSRSSSSGR